MNSEWKKISVLLKETAESDNWTGINVKQALENITRDIAVKRIHDKHLNIAELLAHLSCWNKVMINRLDGIKYEPAPDEDFPTHSKLTEKSWEKIKQDFFKSIHQLIEKIESKKDNLIDEPMFKGSSSGYRNLYGQVAHLHYHLGQIVLLKKIFSEQ